LAAGAFLAETFFLVEVVPRAGFFAAVFTLVAVFTLLDVALGSVYSEGTKCERRV
jgi:hypothetical protein